LFASTKPMNKTSTRTWALGVMSGTSMDGIDLALCSFQRQGKQWHFYIDDAQTLSYPSAQLRLLERAFLLDGPELAALHFSLGKEMGKAIREFLAHAGHIPEFVASHGHTLYHQPDKGYTFQAGSGAAIAAVTGLPVVCDFRSTDVALGGQGAPLVPLGDACLFPEYAACVNLGGIVNISLDAGSKKRLALDVCAGNQLLNFLAKKKGLPFDEGGKLAATGKLLPDVFKNLNAHPWYKKTGARSLGKEWVDAHVLPHLQGTGKKTVDLLHTVCMHIAFQLSKHLPASGKILLTGGGAFNGFLVQAIQSYARAEVIVPDEKTVKYKEALVFAFLGLLRMQGDINVRSEYTGAAADSVSGAVYLP